MSDIPKCSPPKMPHQSQKEAGLSMMVARYVDAHYHILQLEPFVHPSNGSLSTVGKQAMAPTVVWQPASKAQPARHMQIGSHTRLLQ